jgi:hypothetical protein
VRQPEVQKLLGNGQEKIVRGKALQTLNAGSCLNSVVIASPEAVGSPNPFTVVAPHADTKSTGRYFQVMAQSAFDKIPPGFKAGRADG